MSVSITISHDGFWIKTHTKVRRVAGVGGRRHRETRLSKERIASRARVDAFLRDPFWKKIHNQMPTGPTIGPIRVDPYVGAMVHSSDSGRVHILAVHVGGPYWTLGNGRTINLLERLRRGTMRVM